MDAITYNGKFFNGHNQLYLKPETAEILNCKGIIRSYLGFFINSTCQFEANVQRYSHSVVPILNYIQLVQAPSKMVTVTKNNFFYGKGTKAALFEARISKICNSKDLIMVRSSLTYIYQLWLIFVDMEYLFRFVPVSDTSSCEQLVGHLNISSTDKRSLLIYKLTSTR